MSKKLIRIAVAAVMLLGVFSLAACAVDIDGRHNGFSSGFNFTGSRYYEIMSAAKSNKTEFNVDDITLDLYFGWFGSDSSHMENGNTLHIVFYITTNEVGRWIDPQQDYHNIENQHFITEVIEFDTKVFAASQTKRDGKLFNHSEKIVIPRESLQHQQGVLELYAQTVRFSNEDDLYHFDYSYSGVVKIAYNFINDNTIRLSK